MVKYCPLCITAIGAGCVPEHCAPACELAGEGNTPICPISAAVSSLATLTSMLDMALPTLLGGVSITPEVQQPQPTALERTLAKLGVSQEDSA